MFISIYAININGEETAADDDKDELLVYKLYVLCKGITFLIK